MSPIVKIALMIEQVHGHFHMLSIEELLQFKIFFSRLIVSLYMICPLTFYRVEDKQVADVAAACQTNADPAGIIVYFLPAFRRKKVISIGKLGTSVEGPGGFG